MLHLRPRLAFLLLFCSGLSLAQSQPTVSLDLAEEAELHFRLGAEAYRAGDYRQALVHLLHSNRMAPNKNVIFNIAKTYEQLGEYAQAWRHYGDYLALETDPARRKVAEDAAAKIQDKVALLKVVTRPEGAVLYVDRKDLGARGAAPRSLALEPGTHKIIAELDGFEPAESKPVEVSLGTERVVTLDLRQILGTVQLTGGPTGAQVRVDDENGPVVGLLPGVMELPPGQHVLIITAPGYQTLRQLVQVGARATVQVAANLDLVTGTLVVNAAERGALIEIDGKAAGFTPAVLPAVASGEHTLKVTLAGYRPYEQPIEVKPNEQTVVNARLRSLQEVTAASRAAQSIEDAPASVTLISQEEIRAFGYETLYDALGGARGVYQTNDLIYQYLGFRGFSRLGDYGNRVLVTMDGHAMNDDQLGSSYVSYDLMADLMDVERIEVVRGPGSALYGTNAFFGVLNVVTRDGETMNRPQVSLAADGTRTARLKAELSGKKDADLGGYLSVSGVTSQGRDYYFEEFDTPDLGDGLSENADGMVSGTLSAKGWWNDITVQGLINTRDKRIPNGAYETILGDEDAATVDTRGFLELRFEPRIGETLQIYSRAYMDRYIYEATYPYADTEIGNVTDAWDGAWAGLEPRVVWTPLQAISLTAGAEARFDYLAHISSKDAIEAYLDENPTYQTLSAYAVADARVGEWLDASVGGRVDHFSYAKTSTSDPADQTAFNPRLAIILKPSKNDIVKVLTGRAFRAPSPYELNYNDEGYTQLPAPSDIKPEQILTGELEYTRRLTEVASVVGAVYYNQITNLIDLDEVQSEDDPDLTLLQYNNVGANVQTLGEEFEIRRTWRDGWMVAFSQSFQHTREGDLFGDGELTNSPAHLLAFKGAAPFVASGGSTVATRVRYESPRLTTADTTTEPALLWDLTLTGQVPAARLTYGVGVRNILDWKIEHPGNWDYLQTTLEQPGRTFWTSMSISF